ncbi:MAG: hypothetical protein ACLVC1_12970 [Mediterraneibacter gnavus]
MGLEILIISKLCPEGDLMKKLTLAMAIVGIDGGWGDGSDPQWR